jgi:hypothetical protein
VAVAIWRDLSDPRAFGDGLEYHENIRRTAQAIELHHLQESSASQKPALILDIAGETYRLDASDYKGSPNNPYSFDDLCNKFQRYAEASIDPSATENTIELVRTLEEVTDIAELTTLLAP